MAIQAPIDYTVDVKNPFLEGLAAYQQGQQQRQALEAEQAQQQANFERKKAMADFAAKPDKTAEDYMRFLEANPDLAASYKDIYNMRSEEWKQADIVNAQRVHSALATGNIDAAKADLDRQIEANKNSGDMAQAESLQMIRDQIDINPKGAEVASGSFLAAIQDPEKFAENMERIAENKRQIELQPYNVEKMRLENIQAGIDAGLSGIDARKKLKEIDKLDADTQKTIMEMEGMKKGGILSMDKKVELEQKLSDKYYKRNENYLERLAAYNNLVESAKQNTGPGDYALIMAFNKMLDPRSVVRESEFAQAEISAGRLQKWLNSWSKFKEGDRLNNNQRQQFINLAKKYMDEAEKNEKLVTNQLDKTINTYKLNRDVVLPERRTVKETILPKTQEEQPAAAGTKTAADWQNESIESRKQALINLGM